MPISGYAMGRGRSAVSVAGTRLTVICVSAKTPPLHPGAFSFTWLKREYVTEVCS